MWTEIYYQTIDTALAESDPRFSSDSIVALKIVATFITNSGTYHFLNSDALLTLA